MREPTDHHMSQSAPVTGIQSVMKAKPLQTGKFVGILLTLILGVAGFFRLIDVGSVIEGTRLLDSQLLALILIPILSFALICIVFLELLVTGIQVLRSEQSLSEQISGRHGYVMLRGLEAILGIIGVLIMSAVIPVLFADSTPAPAGVGAMLLLMIVGIGLLIVSFIRSSAELFVYHS